MPKNINSAFRLHRILEQHRTQPDGKQAMEAWAGILNVTEKHPHKRVIIVGELIHAMHRELEYASHGLAKLNFSNNLYETAFSKIETALSPLLLPATWSSVTQYLTPDVITALAFCAEILPNEESEISGAELDSIRNKLSDLKDSLDDASLPQRLRKLIEHHIELIERAISEYKISGAIALREAARTALGEMIEAREEISAEKNSPAVSKLEAAWKALNEAADIAIKAEGIAELGQKAFDVLLSIL